MSLITWTSDVKITYQEKDDAQQALMIMLSRDYDKISQWEGKLVKQTLIGNTKVTCVQVRKVIHATNVLISIGITDQMLYNRHALNKESLICISANGKMNYTIDEITELNLVIKEAYGVYCNLTEEQKCTEPATLKR
jgi:hypothetical protein